MRGTLLLVAALLLGGIVSMPTPCQAQTPDHPFIRGDVNRDGTVGFADLVPLIDHLLISGGNPSCPDSADINDDGVLSLLDVFGLVSFYLVPSFDASPPAPFPDPGFDPSPDDGLPPCATTTNDPSGSEIQHIYFSLAGGSGSQGLAAAPGQTGVCLPVFLDTNTSIQGYTVSLSYRPDDVLAASFDFSGSVGEAQDADLLLAEETAMVGFLYAYALLEIVPPFSTNEIPAGEELLLGTLIVDLSDDLEVGGRVDFKFEPTPEMPPIRNETAAAGAAVYPNLYPLELPIVSPDTLFVRGDLNNDHTHSLEDGITLLELIFGPTADPTICLDAADFDDSGTLNVADAVGLLTFVFVGGEPPAAPYPYPGIDPSDNGSIAGCN